MFPKSSSEYNARFYLGLIFITPGLCLQLFSPRHSQYQDFAFALIFAGFAFWQFGTYLFVPLTLFSTAALLDLSIHSQVSHTVSLVLASIALALGFWGAWRVRQAKIAQKKLN